MDNEEKKNLVKIATWYYHHGWTQAKIAKRLGVSRSLIAKKIQDAKDEGIIEVFIKDESFHTVTLEQKLEELFKLEEAIVISTNGLTKIEVLSVMGKQSAYYLKKKISEISNLGISWGKSIRSFVDEFPYVNLEHLNIVPLIGGMGSDNIHLHSNQLCYDFQKKTNGTSKYLYAPALVDEISMKEDLIKNKYISEVLEAGKNVDMALVGIGTPYNSTMQEIGYLIPEDFTELKKNKVVGDMNSRFYNKQGEEAATIINQQVIGVSLDELKNIPTLVTFAHDIVKVEPLKVALKHQLLDIIVVTDEIAESLIKDN